MYVHCKHVEFPVMADGFVFEDTKRGCESGRKVKVFNQELALEIGSEDIHYLESYPRDEHLITLRLTESWGKVLFVASCICNYTLT